MSTNKVDTKELFETKLTVFDNQFRVSKGEILIALALLALAALQCTGQMPEAIDSKLFVYIAGGSALAGIAYGIYAYKKYQEKVVLISSLALLVLGLVAYFGELTSIHFAIGIIGLSSIVLAKNLLDWKVQKEAKNEFKNGLKSELEHTNEWEKNILKIIACLGLIPLVFGAMKLCDTLPNALDGHVLTYVTLGFGTVTTIFNLYRIKKDKVREDICESLLASTALLAIGLLAITHQINAFQNAQALVGIEAGFIGFNIINFFYQNRIDALEIKAEFYKTADRARKKLEEGTNQ